MTTAPPTILRGEPTAAHELVAATLSPAFAGGEGPLGAASFEGTVTAQTRFTAPSVSTGAPVGIPMRPFEELTPPNSGFIQGSGPVPSVTFPELGAATLTLESIALNLTLRRADGTAITVPPAADDGDGNPETFDADCRSYLGEGNLLWVRQILSPLATPLPASGA